VEATTATQPADDEGDAIGCGIQAISALDTSVPLEYNGIGAQVPSEFPSRPPTM